MTREQSLTMSVMQKSLVFFPHDIGKYVARIGFH